MERHFIQMGPRKGRVSFASASVFEGAGGAAHATAVLLGGTGQFVPSGVAASQSTAALLGGPSALDLRGASVARGAAAITGSAAITPIGDSSSTSLVLTGHNFPSNTGTVSNANSVRFKFTGSALPPIYGTGGSGLCIFVKYRPAQQTGYYTNFFWANDSGVADLTNFQWSGGSADSYYGMHLYPPGGTLGTTHNWEISVLQGDDITTDAGTIPSPVTKGLWYSQCSRVSGASGAVKNHEFFFNLPSTAADQRISFQAPSTYGNNMPPSPALTFADAPWRPCVERASGVLRGYIIINALLSNSNMLSFAACETDAQVISLAATLGMSSALWYVNMNPASVNDISDKGPNAHHPAWFNANRPTFYTSATVPSAPTNLQATAGNAQAVLTWTASSGATSYNVKFATVSGGPYTTFSSETTTTETVTGLTNGTQYFFVVSAVNTAGESSNSSQVSATPQSSSSVTITLNIGSDPAMPSGGYKWGQVFIANDGMMMDALSGAHGDDENGVRGFNPYTFSRVDAAGTSRAARTGWQRVPNTNGDNQTLADNTWVLQHDNKPHWNFRSLGLLIIPGIGVYDTAGNSWVAGNLAGYPPWTDFVHVVDPADIDNNGGPFGNFWAYNVGSCYVSALDCVFAYGGGLGSGSGPHNLTWKISRTVPADGTSKPVKLQRFNKPAGWPEFAEVRNKAVSIGPYVYLGGSSIRISGGSGSGDPYNGFWRIDVRDMSTTVQLANLPTTEQYTQLAYDSRRKRILLLGDSLWAYNIDANSWSVISPSGWPAGQIHKMGEYHEELDRVYFRGGTGGGVQSEAWHEVAFETPASGNRWRSIPMTATNNPFQNLSLSTNTRFNVGKHVCLEWHPVKKRVYSWSGDFGANMPSPNPFSYDGGAGTDTQPSGGSTMFTHQPGSTQSFPENSTNGRNDMYSIDPYASGNAAWRLEHPYLPSNIVGNPEPRPPCPDQSTLVWDEVRDCFWCIVTYQRFGDAYQSNPWFVGTTWAADVSQPPGTWKWRPSANGGSGTFEFMTQAACAIVGGIGYVGNRLQTGFADERLAYWGRDTQNDVMVAPTTVGDSGTGKYIIIFKPANIAGSPYEYRHFMPTQPYKYFRGSSSQVACVDGWMYYVAIVQEGVSGGADGPWKSKLVRVNITKALQLANTSQLPNDGTYFDVYDLPWHLPPPAFEVTYGGATNWQEHCGVVAVDRKVVVINSYDGIIDSNGTFKMHVFDHDTRRFIACDSPPQPFAASSWVALPDTGEVMMGITTTDNLAGNNNLWIYRVR